MGITINKISIWDEEKEEFVDILEEGER